MPFSTQNLSKMPSRSRSRSTRCYTGSQQSRNSRSSGNSRNSRNSRNLSQPRVDTDLPPNYLTNVTLDTLVQDTLPPMVEVVANQMAPNEEADALSSNIGSVHTAHSNSTTQRGSTPKEQINQSDLNTMFKEMNNRMIDLSRAFEHISNLSPNVNAPSTPSQLTEDNSNHQQLDSNSSIKNIIKQFLPSIKNPIIFKILDDIEVQTLNDL